MFLFFTSRLILSSLSPAATRIEFALDTDCDYLRYLFISSFAQFITSSESARSITSQAGYSERVVIMKQLGLVLLVALAALNCGGVTFNSADVNEALPDFILNRAIYTQSLGYYPHRLIGTVLQQDIDGNYQDAGFFIPDGIERPPVKVVENPNFYYESMVNLNDHSQTEGLGFVLSYLSNGVFQISICDESEASLVTDDPEIQELLYLAAAEWATSHNSNSESPRLWVHSVVVMRFLSTKYFEISADAEGVVGQIVGLDAGVFQKEETTLSYTVTAFEALNMDLLGELIGRSGSMPERIPLEQIMDSVRVSGLLEGEIFLNE